MNRHASKFRPSRIRSLEALEPRLTMNGDSEWHSAQSLTLSFAADGTSVSGQANQMDAVMIQAGIPNWRQTVISAFQTWAQAANINVGLVTDNGQALGIQGQAHNDGRFGDIRIAGIPLSLDTYGEAIPESRTMAGTWSGDVIFNTNAPWTSEADLFAVALHEAGHVFGLDHSVDPLSPMFKHGIAATSGPTTADVSAIQSLYGPRKDDVYDAAQPNSTIAKSSRIPHSEAVDGYTGQTPLIVYGDLLNTSDKDVFELPVLTGYHNGLTFDLVTRGISFLSAKFSVMDRNGNILDQVTTTDHSGSKVSLHITSATEGKYYLKVETASSDIYASGSYAIVTKYDTLLTTPQDTIDRVTLEGFQWQARTDDSLATVDTRNLLSTGTVVLSNDSHQDDSTSTATILKPSVDTSARRAFQVVGTISDSTDLDLYRIRSQNSPSSTRGLTILIESLEFGGLVPSITVLDKTGVVMPVTMITSGNGEVLLRVSGIEQNKDYFVQIASGYQSTGNYAMVATFDDIAPTRTSVVTDSLSATEPVHDSTLFVARPQLISFALQSSSASASASSSAIWATIFDESHRTVAFLGSEIGGYRSSNAILLQPGTYFVQVESRDASGQNPTDAQFQFFMDHISDPVGPPVLPPGTQPAFGYDPATGLFTYPGQIPTASPVVIVPPLAPVPPPPTDLVPIPLNHWFWAPDFLPTNPSDPLDASGDGFVTPIDALLVINFLNSVGGGSDPTGPRISSYLDTSADGFISPIDVLLVINRLNNPGTTSAGEAASVTTATNSSSSGTASQSVVALDPAVVDLIFAASVSETTPRKTAARRTF